MRLVLTLAALVGGFFMPAWAQDIHQHHGKSPAIDQFYSTWNKPDKPTESCCSYVDCDEAEARMVNGEWWAKRPRDAKFVRIPPEKVEQNRDSPDGKNHLCKSNWSDEVYCFIVSSGS